MYVLAPKPEEENKGGKIPVGHILSVIKHFIVRRRQEIATFGE